MTGKMQDNVTDIRDITIARQKAQIAELTTKLEEAKYFATVSSKTLSIVMQLPWWQRVWPSSIWETLWSVIDNIKCLEDMYPEDILEHFDPEVFLQEHQSSAA